MGQINTTQNLVAIKEIRHAGQQGYHFHIVFLWGKSTADLWIYPTKGQFLLSFVFFIAATLNKLLNKQLSCQWFAMKWHACDDVIFWW